MIRPICRDVLFLSRRSTDAGPADLPVAMDLMDTLIAHADGCVGMAANMIGVNKRIIAFACGGRYMLMFNPTIVHKSGEYEAEEGCLSLQGARKVKRWQKIEVEYQGNDFRTKRMAFEGWTAEIIQHEIDHCNGVIV